MAKFLGIYREILHSPDREFDDYEILRLTGQRLAEEGLDVALRKPEEAFEERAQWLANPPDAAFVMCEQARMLEFLEDLQARGTVVVNNPAAVKNTYRNRMLPLVEAHSLPFPKSELFSTEDALPQGSSARFAAEEFKRVWVKRGDVHNTQKGDVFLARSLEDVRRAFRDFQARRVRQALLQEHVEGDLVKFYGVSDASRGEEAPAWFQWFYHKNQQLQEYPFSMDELQRATRATARSMGLEVYGGDAIVTPQGRIYVIDINAWPSFALFRADASRAIARHLAAKVADRV